MVLCDKCRCNSLESIILLMAGGELLGKSGGRVRIVLGPAGQDAVRDLDALGIIFQRFGKCKGVLWVSPAPASG